MRWQQQQQQFGRGAHNAAAARMAAEDPAARIGQHHVQVGAVRRHGTGHRQDLQVAQQLVGCAKPA